MNKVCVYAICKNEKHFVERWLDSMQEADYIVVLDTGSDDGTYEALKADKRVTRCEHQVIKPWRFDVARNESMKLIPEDANILICTDLDEILQPGWAQPLREKWVDGFHIRGHYKYIWSHTETGEPGRIFVYDKIHDRHWKWAYPVHEMLIDTRDRGDVYLREHTVNLWDDITLEHFPDNTKSRGTYLPLLELRAKENPDDYYGLFYLSHEYNYRGMYDKSIAILEKIVSEYKHKYSTTELAAAYLFLGDDYRALEDKQKALYFYNMGISTEPTYRECYLNAAEVYNELQMYEAAVAYVRMAEKKTYRHYVWVERDSSYKGQPGDIMAIALYYLAIQEQDPQKKDELLTEAAVRMDSALSYAPHDDRLRFNQRFITKAIIQLR